MIKAVKPLWFTTNKRGTKLIIALDKFNVEVDGRNLSALISMAFKVAPNDFRIYAEILKRKGKERKP